MTVQLARYIERTDKDDGVPGWDVFQQPGLRLLRQAAAAVTFAPSSDGLEFARIRDSIR